MVRVLWESAWSRDKRLYYPVIKGVFNKPWDAKIPSFTIGSRSHASCGFVRLALLRFKYQGVEIHFSPGVQIRGDTDTESRYVEENCCLDTTFFFPCVFVKFFFEASQNLSWEQNRDKWIYLEKICFLIHVLQKSHELHFACINLGWALPKTLHTG